MPTNNGGFSNSMYQFPQQYSLSIVSISTEEEGRNYPVAAGCAVYLINEQERWFLLKSVGPNGAANPLRKFSFTEEAIEQDDSVAVTRSEFNSIQSQLTAIQQQLSQMQQFNKNDRRRQNNVQSSEPNK